jgi:nitroimidazol reductase NimA-like FMN-containing flavoprotein (pyridoxamine 5'-phosphate oxidase superfamily)
MRGIRRKEKEITDKSEMLEVLDEARYVVVAMCMDNEPYLVTLSHGYDRERNCIYFHCAKEGKKVDILRAQNTVWGQALVDRGYVQGACDHLFVTTQFRGKVNFVETTDEKRHALEVMIHALEDHPEKVLEAQVNERSIRDVHIGRIDIEFMSGKKSDKVIISGQSNPPNTIKLPEG